MKKLVLKKEEALPLAEFLAQVNLETSKLTRLRTQLKKKLVAIATETDEDRLEIVKRYAIKGEDGEPIIKKEDDGTDYYPTEAGKEQALNDDYKELLNEEVAIEIGEYSSKLTPLFEHMLKDEFTIPGGFEGANADRYDRLMDIWEAAHEDKEEEK